MKTVCPQGRVGSNPTLSVRELGKVLSRSSQLQMDKHYIVDNEIQPWRSTQEVEGTPLERVQVVNSGARVQIPPSPFGRCVSAMTYGSLAEQRIRCQT